MTWIDACSVAVIFIIGFALILMALYESAKVITTGILDAIERKKT